MFDLFKAIGLGLAVLLPLANPLTTVALFLGLAGNMNNAERNKQALMASVYVFAILMVSWYAGQVVMNTFGISIPGLRIAGGLIVAFIGFRMLFPQQKAHDSMEAKIKSEELQDEPTANIAFVPLAMGDSVGLSAQFRRDYASGWQRRHRGHLATDGLSAGLHGRAVYY